MHCNFRVFLRAGALVSMNCALLAAQAAEPQAKPQPMAPKAELIVDNGKSLFVLSDRQEKLRDFFVRRHLVVGSIPQEDLNRLTEAKSPLEEIFLAYTSANDDPQK